MVGIARDDGEVQLVGHAQDDGERRAELVSHIGEELVARGLQPLHGTHGAVSRTNGIDECGDDSQSQQSHEERGDEDDAVFAPLLVVLIAEFVVVQLGIGLAEHVVHFVVVQRVHHGRIAAQGHQRLARLVGFERLGQRLVVIAHGAHVAHLLLQRNGTADDGHGLAVALHVEQIEGHIL